jgi:hypothetical protein
VSLFGRIIGLDLADGPRVLTGRVWNIANWHSWQRNQDQEVALLRALAVVPPRATRVIIVDYWDEDRFGHLALQEAGYRIDGGASAVCAASSETFVKGTSRVILLRMHHGYVRYWRSIRPERLERWGLPCIRSAKPSDMVLVGSAPRLATFFNGSSEAAAPVVFKAVRVDPSELGLLVKLYRRDAARAAQTGEPIGTLDEASATTRKRTGFGR